MRHFPGRKARVLAGLIALLADCARATTGAPVAFRWLIQQEEVLHPGAKNGTQSAQNAGALTFTFDDADVDTPGRITQAATREPAYSFQLLARLTGLRGPIR